ncbi:sulfotransferase 1B1-like isoform X1 [Haliotis rufescens]|uniref:sulfotransferase 1B1-like isoform X1 n=1 Tax=Haliotis rufescens TaxID=6454 RepID=UPI00201F66B5|nr:sulfotransferase 1B1-like isoform X1 [Haliotis rufescens]
MFSSGAMSQGITVCGNEIELNNPGQDLVHVKDRSGKAYSLQRYDGVYYNTFYNVAHLQQIKGFKLRADDVYFAGYLRTGTHWTYEMMSMLLKGKAETAPIWKGANQLEIVGVAVLDALPSPRIINSHVSLFHSPDDLIEKKCRIVYSLRDPRDVAVSMYNLSRSGSVVTNYTGDFKDYFYLFLEGKADVNGYFDHMKKAENFLQQHPDIPVLTVVYEEMLENKLMAVERLAGFLGVQKNVGLFEAVAEKCQFSKMVVDKSAYTIKFSGENSIFRKGVSGDWKNWFTDEMLEDYIRVYNEEMSGSRFYRKEYVRQK